MSTRIAALERKIARLERLVEALGRPARWGAARSPRLAITAAAPGGDYPEWHEPQDTYWIKFVDSTFTEGAGEQPLTQQPRQEEAKHLARVIGAASPITYPLLPSGSVIRYWQTHLPEGTLVAVFRDHGRWWIVHAWQPLALKRATLGGAPLSSGGSAAATFTGGPEDGDSVSVSGWLVQSGQQLPAATQVVIAYIDGVWYVISANACPEAV